MKYIPKNPEPRSLTEHKCKEYASYDNLPTETKNDIRRSLLLEQGHVCCYCMRRIYMDGMKIEHWKPQRYVELSLSYSNMLGACDGNEGEPSNLQCCDTHKGEDEIFINPLNPNCESYIKYRGDGTIYSDNETVNEELNKVLNLNHQRIKENRKSVIDAINNHLMRKYPEKNWTKVMIQQLINKWSNKDSEGKYQEYYGVALYRLQKLYSKAS